MMNTFDALISLRPGCGFALNEDGSIEWSPLNTSACPTDEEIAAEVIRLQAEYDNNQYQRDRKQEYPPLADQLDMIYHDRINNTDTWMEAIQAVKNKYPKS